MGAWHSTEARDLIPSQVGSKVYGCSLPRPSTSVVHFLLLLWFPLLNCEYHASLLHIVPSSLQSSEERCFWAFANGSRCKFQDKWQNWAAPNMLVKKTDRQAALSKLESVEFRIRAVARRKKQQKLVQQRDLWPLILRVDLQSPGQDPRSGRDLKRFFQEIERSRSNSSHTSHAHTHTQNLPHPTFQYLSSIKISEEIRIGAKKRRFKK